MWLTLGPDGALYVCDFYREVIETPLSLPDDIKKKYNLESRARGRIWRVRPDDGKTYPRPNMATESSADLVKHLSDANFWWRITAQRLLVERQSVLAINALGELAEEGRTPEARTHALWSLEGLHALSDASVEKACSDPIDELRVQSLKLSESRAGAGLIRVS